MVYKYYAITHMGYNKANNEDRIYIDGNIINNGHIKGLTGDDFIVAICDGVGGEKGGEIAADAVANQLKTIDNNISASKIVNKMLSLNSTINLMQKNMPEYNNMSTTIGGIAVYSDKFVSFNLGDTRVYCLENQELLRLSEDHVLPEDKATLTQYLGSMTIRPHLSFGTLNQKQIFFICSDGIYKTVPEARIKEVISGHGTIDKKAKAILNFAIQNSSDDLSLLILESGGISKLKGGE